MTADAEGDSLCTLQILRQQSIELSPRMGEISPETLHRTFTTPTPACPDLSSWLAGIHEEHKPLAFRAMWQEQSHGIGLIKTGQIPEIAVLAKRPLCVCMVCDQSRSRDHSGDTAQLSHETLAAVGEKLGVKNRRKINHGRDRAPEKRQDGSQSARA